MVGEHEVKRWQCRPAPYRGPWAVSIASREGAASAQAFRAEVGRDMPPVNQKLPSRTSSFLSPLRSLTTISGVTGSFSARCPATERRYSMSSYVISLVSLDIDDLGVLEYRFMGDPVLGSTNGIQGQSAGTNADLLWQKEFPG